MAARSKVDTAIRRRGESPRVSRVPQESSRGAADAAHRVAVFGSGLSLDGLTYYTVGLAETIAGDLGEVLLVSPTGPLHEAAATLDARWHVVPPPGESLGFFQRRALAAALDEFKPTVVHATSLESAALAAKSAQRLNLPACVTIHGVSAREMPTTGDRRFKGFIAQDQMVRERLLNDCRLDRDTISLLSPAVMPAHGPLQRRVRGTRKRPVIGIVGPLSPGCGHDAFLDAAQAIVRRGVDAIFTILGNGPEAPRLREEIEKRGVSPQVVLVEQLFDYGRIWEPLDVVVVDSRPQASASMTLTAMGHGLPVINSEGGAVFGIIEDGVDGMLVKRDDSVALAERIMIMIENPSERIRMGGAGYNKVEANFNTGRLAQCLGRVYNALSSGEPLPRSFEGGLAGPQRAGKAGTRNGD